ncbi:hypothetical protein MPH_08962 [Macrophomina phaseolina MS6]|uniref:Uncharacterized protein n=1 Tax=Macrophomina phaseolina (strain MS6) TaxID=1126212 RepID=K2RUJ9_MACPH|nr:hypothetical protein MPH_08962 [Macrophomina phaseolina MS6]
MQSFFQYRRFRTNLKKQYERDREKTAALAQQHRGRHGISQAASRSSTSFSSSEDSSSGSSSSSKSPLPAISNDHRDPEKGEGSHSHHSASAPPPFNSTNVRTAPRHEGDAIRTEDVPALNHATPPAEPAEEEEEEEEELAHSTAPHQLSRPSTLHTTASSAATNGTALGLALTGVSVRSRSHDGRGGGAGGKVFIVGYEGPHDPLNPHNWSYATRIMATFLVAGIGFVVGVASSIDAEALRPAAEEFGVAEVVESLATGKLCGSIQLLFLFFF